MVSSVRLKWISIFCLLVSLFFFLWAAYNTSDNYQDGLIVDKSIDDGLVCFPFTFLSGIIGYFSISSPTLQLSRAPGLFIIFSFTFTVSIFLSAAICINTSSLHRAYLIISSLVWGSYGFLFYKEIELWRQEKVKDSSEHLLQFAKTESQLMSEVTVR
jgi:hypothetical protein